MKKIVCTSVLLCFIFVLAFSQDSQRRQRFVPEEIAKQATEWMTKELKLTPAQIAPVDSINLLYAKAQQVMFQSAKGDREKIRATLLALEFKKEESLSGILTKEQMDLYRKKIKENLQNRQRNSRERNPE